MFTDRTLAERTLLLACASLLFGATQPADTARFAIGCTGTARFTDTVTGERITRNYELPLQVYVFDPGNRTVQRALEPRQEFEDICFRGGFVDSIDFSPGLIAVRSERAGEMCDFRVNRRTGAAEFFSHNDLPAGRYQQMEWRMSCSRTEVPVFDPTGNRF